MLQHASTSDLKIKAGKPPKQTLGYLAPSVGSFTLHGGKDGKGDAAFVWYHGCHLVVDWHHEALKFAGIATDEAGTKYWVYNVADADHDVETCADEHGHEGMRIFFAQTRTNSSDKGRGERDEGFRIFYSLHEHLHLWAWDARTFGGHAHAH